MYKFTFLLFVCLLPILGCNQKTTCSFSPCPEQELLQLHNQERAKNLLILDAHLIEYAQNHADWMAKSNRLRHSSMSDLIKGYSLVAENIAFGQETPQDVMNAWMTSSGHRSNILNKKLSNVGFGVSYDSNNAPYWCVCFGKK